MTGAQQAKACTATQRQRLKILGTDAACARSKGSDSGILGTGATGRVRISDQAVTWINPDQVLRVYRTGESMTDRRHAISRLIQSVFHIHIVLVSGKSSISLKTLNQRYDMMLSLSIMLDYHMHVR
jgi:hypothetical protein